MRALLRNWRAKISVCEIGLHILQNWPNRSQRSGSPLSGEDAEGPKRPSELSFFRPPNYSSTVYNSVINGRESVRARNSEQDLSEITEIWEHIIGIFPPQAWNHGIWTRDQWNFGFWKKCEKSIESEGHDTRFWKFWTENKPISAENSSKMTIFNKISDCRRKWRHFGNIWRKFLNLAIFHTFSDSQRKWHYFRK